MTFFLLALACARDPLAPPDVKWDVDACTDCGMLVSDPGYAAAIVQKDGTMLPFDDAGCLFRYVVAHKPEIAAMWFHDGTNDRWLRESEVAFTTSSRSPMGSGLRPVPAGTPGAIGVGEASSRAVTP